MDKLTVMELFTLRDACIHAIRANKKNAEMLAEYDRIFKKIGQIIAQMGDAHYGGQ